MLINKTNGNYMTKWAPSHQPNLVSRQFLNFVEHN